MSSIQDVGPGPVRLGVLGEPDRGTVLFVPGRGDSLELRESIATHLAATLGVRFVMAEHHGQGGSGHFGRDPDAVHIDDFATHSSVLRRVLTDVLPKPPRYLLSHSMGGLLALQLLQEQKSSFAAAVFLSPMWDFAAPLPRSVISIVAGAMTAIGRGSDYAAGERSFELDRCLDMRTDDEAARRRLTSFATSHRSLLRGGSTWQWVRAATKAMRAVDASPIETIDTPVWVLSADDDGTVSREAQRVTAARLPRATYVEVPGRHDLLSGGDGTVDLLQRLLAEALTPSRTTT